MIDKVPLPVDNNDMISRQCCDEKCKKIFKVKSDDYNKFQNEAVCCPHCGSKEFITQMITDEQWQYIESKVGSSVMCDLYQSVKKNEIKPNPNSMIGISFSWSYEESPIKEPLESELEKMTCCKKCNRTISVDSTPSFCPFCESKHFTE